MPDWITLDLGIGAVDSRECQGLPARITDPVVLSNVATLVCASKPSNRPSRRPGRRRGDRGRLDESRSAR
jgi:hypothetical protein